jgi:hypothetical protein
MTISVKAVQRKDAGNTSVYDLMVGSDLLGKLWVNRDRRRSWSELSFPTLLEPTAVTIDMFRDFTRGVYSDLYGKFAEDMCEECRVVMGEPGSSNDVGWLSKENVDRTRHLLDRMKQRISPHQFVRFETAAHIGNAGFSLQRNPTDRPGPWVSALVSHSGGWTPDLIGWTLRQHANQDLATSIDVAQLNQVLLEETLPGRRLAA